MTRSGLETRSSRPPASIVVALLAAIWSDIDDGSITDGADQLLHRDRKHVVRRPRGAPHDLETTQRRVDQRFELRVVAERRDPADRKARRRPGLISAGGAQTEPLGID